MPGRAERYSTCMITFHCGTPSESAASRICDGTRRSISSVVRTTTGSTMNASATAPASAENRPPLKYMTKTAYTNRPSTIDGADSRMSLTKRTTVPSLRLLPYSASQVPAAMPSGVPISNPMPHIRMLPTNALRRPPTSIGAG